MNFIRTLHPATYVCFALLVIGIVLLTIAAQHLAVQAIHPASASAHIDRAVQMTGSVAEHTVRDTFVYGTLEATCDVRFIHFTTQPDEFLRANRFTGTLEEFNGRPSFVIEEFQQ